MSKIKICGLKRPEDIAAVNDALPDYIGFVFAKSPRQLDRKTASGLKGLLDNRIKAAGVFVNEDISAVTQLANEGVIDLVQLHGDEDAGYVAALKGHISLPVIKALRVRADGSLAQDILPSSSLPCEFLLLDTYSKTAHGGTGESFDWGCLKSISLEKPYFLAGGIALDNIGRALALNPFCIDVSSGVETNGLKDPEKIKQIVSTVRCFL